MNMYDSSLIFYETYQMEKEEKKIQARLINFITLVTLG